MIDDSAVRSEYDKMDVDNLFLIIHKDNLNTYFARYNCNNVAELEDILWINYGITFKIV